MQTFDCACGNKLYFENTVCFQCNSELGYLPDRGTIARIEPSSENCWRAETALGEAGQYRKCSNYEVHDACNWMIPADEASPFCHACRLNLVIPDLSLQENLQLWYRIEQAKRRLVYTLDMLGLPVFDKSVDSERGLAFEFLRDPISDTDEFFNLIGESQRILTGHKRGIITINVAEADPGARERMREQMREAYRTLLGHFRHEIGHYYWELLVLGSPWLEKVRALFGDEREDYNAALSAYYERGPSEGWPSRFISAYASSHPWEDWAESWTHYLHMADTLETAHHLGLSVRGRAMEPMLPGNPERLTALLENWSELTEALNMLNRSMGLPDAYPYTIGPAATEKLLLIDEIIANAARNASSSPTPTRNGAAPTAPA